MAGVLLLPYGVGKPLGRVAVTYGPLEGVVANVPERGAPVILKLLVDVLLA